MMSVQSSKKNNKDKVYWPIWVIIGLAILLIISAILQVFTPRSPEIPVSQLNQGNIQNTTTKYKQIKFTGDYPTKPAVLPIAQVVITDFESELISQLTSQFNLKKDDDNLWLGEEFSISLHNDLISLNRNYDIKKIQESKKKISLNEALITTQNFLSSYLPQYQVTPFIKNAYLLDSTSVQYSRSLEPITNNKLSNEAEVIIIPFNYSLANYPIFYQDSYLPFIEAVVVAGEGVTKVDINTKGLSFQAVDEMKIIDVDEAVLNIIQRNQAEIVFYEHEYAGELKINDISSGELTAVRLEIRADPENDLAYPFYHFSGEFLNNNGQKFKAEVITPAVRVRTK